MLLPPPALPKDYALCGRVPPWHNNTPQLTLFMITAITHMLYVVISPYQRCRQGREHDDRGW